jgi:parallel beta-helix repeat protein
MHRSLIGLALASLLVGTGAPAEAAGVCSTSLQSLVDATPPGGVLRLPECIYEQQVVLSKPITLDGQGQAEIRGSDVWSSWSQSGSTWISANMLPPFSNGAEVICDNPRCNWPEQAFFDGTPLTQVAVGVTPTSGQFSLNSGRQIILADNPAGHVIEVSTRTMWIDTESDNVTIQGLTMRHAANPAQVGAVGNQGRNGWTLQNNQLYDTHGATVVVGGASNPSTQTRVLNNRIAESGFEGLLGNENVNTLIQGNEIFWNNTEGFMLDWAGGGVKMSGMTNATLDSNVVHDNSGPGLWCDQACSNITFSSNRVYNNNGHRDTGPDGSPQIFFEISEGALIQGNAVWGATGYWPGIYIASSGNAEVRWNVVAWSSRGLETYLQTRCCIPPQGVTNVYFHDNDVIMGPTGDYAVLWGDDGSNQITTASNHVWNNAIWYPGPENGQPRFRWGNQQFSSLSGFAATAGGLHSTYLTAQQALAALTTYVIPVPGGVGLTANTALAGTAQTTAPAAARSATLRR